jgi:hypothetical protein
MNERQTDLAMVGVFLSGLAMMAAIALATRLTIVCVVIFVAGCAMSVQRSTEPFSPSFRRQLRGLVLVVAAVSAVALVFSHVESCVIWLALVSLTACTYLSLRLRIFGQAPPHSE